MRSTWTGSCRRSTIRRSAICASLREVSRTICSSARAHAGREGSEMAPLPAKLLKLSVIVSSLGGLYLVALHKHAERDEIRQAAVELTPGCKAKLESYALRPGSDYRSPYVLRMTGTSKQARGYTEDDVRAIERGCNIVDDTQGQLAKDAARERWNSSRFMRGKHSSCE